jgi:adenylate cyclase
MRARSVWIRASQDPVPPFSCVPWASLRCGGRRLPPGVYAPAVRQALTPDEFAERVGFPPDEVERYRSLGLLDPENDGLLDDLDLVRMEFVRYRLAQDAYTLEGLASAVREGRVESMYGRRLFEAGPPITLEEAATRTGLDPDQLRELMSTLGFSRGLRGSDIELLEVLRVARASGLPWEAILGATRVLGDSLRRIADAEIRIVHVYVHERLTAAGASRAEVDRLIGGIEENLAPLIDPMLRWLHQEYLLEAMMEDAFFHLADGEARARDLGSVEVTIAFVDVAAFTALAEASGDDAAMLVLDRIDTIVRPLLVEHDGKLVKQVGDGFMLAFREPAAAVHFAVATQAELARYPDLPAIRVGVNTGPALYRTGDYLGGAVNVASRVAASAMAGQILLTEPVATAASKGGIEVEDIGVRVMRGVDDPLPLYRVRPVR